MAQKLPEVHIIGEILHGYQFSSSNAFAKFTIKSGDQWDCVGGNQSGQTQVDYPGMVSFVFYIPYYMCIYIYILNKIFSLKRNIFGIIQ